MNKAKKILLLIPLMCIALTACTEPEQEKSSVSTPTEAVAEPTPTDTTGGREGHSITYRDEEPDTTEASPEVDTEGSGNSIDGLED